jgi:hypothetical protein
MMDQRRSAFSTFLLEDCPAVQSLLEAIHQFPSTCEAKDVVLSQSFWESEIGIEINQFMQTMDFKIPLLEDVIINCRFDFDPSTIENLIEIVRMLDILGADMKYKEYPFHMNDYQNYFIVKSSTECGLVRHKNY